MNLKSMAAELGVSPATVSRVLNAKKNFSVSPEVRERILTLARSSGYTPNPIYQSMRMKKNTQIAILQPYRIHVFGDTDITAGVDYMCDLLWDRGFSFHSLNHINEHQREYQLPAWKVGAAVAVDVFREELIVPLDRSGVPYVSLNGVAGPNGTAVMTDDYANCRLALEHLHDLGHRRIAYINHYRSPEEVPFTLADQHYSVRERMRAYSDYCAKNGFEPPAESLSWNFTVSETVAAALRRKCTAFVSYSFSLGAEAIHYLKQSGLRVPADISLVVFNNPPLASFLDPPVTCIEIPALEMGKTAAELLLEKHKKSDWRNGETIMFKGKLFQRKSTAQPPRDWRGRHSGTQS